MGGERRGRRDYRGEIATGGEALQGAGSRWIRGPCQTTDSTEC